MFETAALDEGEFSIGFKRMKQDLIFEAIRFVARAHKGQVRRDEKTPYVAHVCGVALTLSSVFGVSDPEMIAAALLHDTLEDTDTKFKDLKKRFGKRVAVAVQFLSKDGSLPKEERERVYRKQLQKAPAEVKVVKLADIYDNLTDAARTSRTAFQSFVPKAESYLRVIAADKSPRLKKTLELVRCRIRALSR